MKKNGSKPALSIVEAEREPRGTITDAYGVGIVGLEMVKQLRGIARTIASATSVKPANAETDRMDLMAAMTLFARNLGQIEDAIDEAMVILEEVEPALKAANE